MALVLEGFSDEPGGLLRQVEIRGDGDFLKTSDFISLHSGDDLRKKETLLSLHIEANQIPEPKLSTTKIMQTIFSNYPSTVHKKYEYHA
jgi:hypothetical protein